MTRISLRTGLIQKWSEPDQDQTGSFLKWAYADWFVRTVVHTDLNRSAPVHLFYNTQTNADLYLIFSFSLGPPTQLNPFSLKINK